MYKVFFSKEAQKDGIKIKQSHLDTTCKKLIELVATDPFSPVPPYERLVGDLKGFYSRRINRQHRFVYEVDEANKIVKVLRMWSHYD